MSLRNVLYYEAGSLPGSLGSLSYNGRYAPLVSTAALQPSFNGSLRLPSFREYLRAYCFNAAVRQLAR